MRENKFENVMKDFFHVPMFPALTLMDAIVERRQNLALLKAPLNNFQSEH